MELCSHTAHLLTGELRINYSQISAYENAVCVRVTEEVSEGGAVVRHQVVDDGRPVLHRVVLHVEEARLKEKVKGLSSPHAPRVLVAAEVSEETGTRTETGDVLPPTTHRQTACTGSR